MLFSLTKYIKTYFNEIFLNNIIASYNYVFKIIKYPIFLGITSFKKRKKKHSLKEIDLLTFTTSRKANIKKKHLKVKTGKR